MKSPRVSVLLPTRNGAATLPAVLQALERQTLASEAEVVVVDSGSTDGTLELVTPRVDRVLHVSPDAFNHGATRNLGVEACRAELVALLVQDAVPASDEWLAELVAPFLEDASLAGTFARQRPRPDASPLTRHYLARWAACSDEPRVNALAGAEELAALAPSERFARCTFDNVSSCVRRSVWLRHPFPPVEIAEDVAWAKTVLLAGYRLAYVPSAVVVHSHERSPRYELWRTYLVHRQLRLLFGLRTVATPIALLRAVASSLLSHVGWLAGEGGRGLQPRSLARGVALAVVLPLGQYLGALSADTGWRLLRPKGV